MNNELIKYIETNILPKYTADAGHRLEHIKYVIRRSLAFADQVENVDKNICYTAAAYHDIGRLIDNYYHEKISAAFVRIDENLQNFFSPEEIELIAEAVEDHRASSKHEPRSIYGKIVSSADRNVSVDDCIARSLKYHLKHTTEGDLDKAAKEACAHVCEKYGPNGYACSKMYFKDPEFEQFCAEMAVIASDPKKFLSRYEKIKQQKAG